MGLDDPYILFISIMILIKLLQSINYSTNYYFSFSFKNKIFFVTFLNIQGFENSQNLEELVFYQIYVYFLKSIIEVSIRIR